VDTLGLKLDELMTRRPGVNLFDGLDAVIFDMDGVVTHTADLHAFAWKRVFDEYLRKKAKKEERQFRPFDIGRDYKRYVDGKQRYDGVESFLSSRGISVPHGKPDDAPDRETVCGLGNRKNKLYLSYLRKKGAKPYPSTVRLIKELRERGIRTAIISASRNCEEVIRSAGVGELFEVKVDGVDVDALGLRGKPEPDIFLEATRRLGSVPSRVSVIEDASSGVRAARRGGIALIVGIDRTGGGESLRNGGADVVEGRERRYGRYRRHSPASLR
jgi:trehalose 6-phosphate phosphatase